jgi:hypothetical protein
MPRIAIEMLVVQILPYNKSKIERTEEDKHEDLENVYNVWIISF